LVLSAAPLIDKQEEQIRLLQSYFPGFCPKSNTLFFKYNTDQNQRKFILLDIKVAKFWVRLFPNLKGLFFHASNNDPIKSDSYMRLHEYDSLTGFQYLLDAWAPTLNTFFVRGFS